jgi:hypothetical protein
MARPTSARLACAPVVALFFFSTVGDCLLITMFLIGCPARAIKNPRPFPAVGFCQNRFSRSTSRHGAVNYDDDQRNLPNQFHLWRGT